MKNKFLQYTLLCCSLIVLFSACRKDPFNGKEAKESGSTFVYITEADGGPYLQFFDVFSDVKPVVLFTVRRDAASKADLQKAISVTLNALPDSAENEGLTPLSADVASFPSAADIATGGVYASANGVTVSADGKVITVNFAAGEFAKNIIYKIDGSKLDLSNTYGSVFQITSLGGFKAKTGFSVVAAGVAVKNAYDGKYALTGSVQRYVAGGAEESGSLNGTLPAGITKDVITTGPNSNAFTIAWADGGGVGGIDGLYFTVDPVTNKVTVAATGNPNLHNIPGQDNFYDPGTRTFTLNFAWYGGAPPPVGSSRQAHMQLAYSGPR